MDKLGFTRSAALVFKIEYGAATEKTEGNFPKSAPFSRVPEMKVTDGNSILQIQNHSGATGRVNSVKPSHTKFIGILITNFSTNFLRNFYWYKTIWKLRLPFKLTFYKWPSPSTLQPSVETEDGTDRNKRAVWLTAAAVGVSVLFYWTPVKHVACSALSIFSLRINKKDLEANVHYVMATQKQFQFFLERV